MVALLPAVERLIELALDEDLGRGDVTSEALCDPNARAQGVFLAKQPLVVSGLDVAARVLARVDSSIELLSPAAPGQALAPGQTLAEVRGPARGLLGGERVALNFLARLCGVATLTRRFVDAVQGTRARITDTRKTTPGWRFLEKRAVRDGGGSNHRADLAAGILIKDNHVALYGVAGALARARSHAPHGLRLEIEITQHAQIEEALSAGADILLFDNMSVAEVAEAVRTVAGRALTEASGGVSLDNVRALAETGVDRISVGRLTHSAPAADISLELGRDQR
jgi:nicotinate-nucleotide pyrophosphorylase (carboxylating)